MTVEESDLDVNISPSATNTTILSSLDVEDDSPQAPEFFNEQATSSPHHSYHADTQESIHPASMQESAGANYPSISHESSSDNALNKTALAVGFGIGIGIHEGPGQLKLALEESEKEIVIKDCTIKELSNEKERIERQLSNAQEELKHLKYEKSKDILAIKELQEKVSKLTAELDRKKAQIASESELIQCQRQMLTMKDKHHEDLTQALKEKHRAEMESLSLRMEKSFKSSNTCKYTFYYYDVHVELMSAICTLSCIHTLYLNMWCS